jgi:hypothetical protein
MFRRLRKTAIGICKPGTAIAKHSIARVKKSSLSLKEMQMSKLFSTLVAGTFAIGSAYALANGLVNSQKQAELDRIIADGNTNATARGEEIAKSANASKNDPPVLPDVSAHQRALDYIIATGQANAPERGKAIARSGAASASQPRVLSGASAHERALDNTTASGNRNGGA